MAEGIGDEIARRRVARQHGGAFLRDRQHDGII